MKYSFARARRLRYKQLLAFEKSPADLPPSMHQDLPGDESPRLLRLYCEGVEHFFDPLSPGDQPLPAPELWEYFDRLAYPIPVQYALLLQFENWQGTPAQQQTLTAGLRLHYRMILQDKRLDLRINRAKTILLLLFGFGVLGLSFGLTQVIQDPFVAEFLSVVATFSLWEAANCFLIERKYLKTEHANSGQLAMAQIEFI